MVHTRASRTPLKARLAWALSTGQPRAPRLPRRSRCRGIHGKRRASQRHHYTTEISRDETRLHPHRTPVPSMCHGRVGGRPHRHQVQPRGSRRHPQGQGGGPLRPARQGEDQGAGGGHRLPQQHPVQGQGGDGGPATGLGADAGPVAGQVRAPGGQGVRGLRPALPVRRLRPVAQGDQGPGGQGAARQARPTRGSWAWPTGTTASRS